MWLSYLRIEKAMLEYRMLRRYHYVITTVTTFATWDSCCDHKEKNIWMSCGTPLTVHSATTFTTLRSCQKNKISFQHYVHNAMIMKKLFTLSLCCCYVYYGVISIMSTTPWLRKKIFSFHFSTTFTTSWSRLKINLLSFQQYIPYTISSVVL